MNKFSTTYFISTQVSKTIISDDDLYLSEMNAFSDELDEMLLVDCPSDEVIKSILNVIVSGKK